MIATIQTMSRFRRSRCSRLGFGEAKKWRLFFSFFPISCHVSALPLTQPQATHMHNKSHFHQITRSTRSPPGSRVQSVLCEVKGDFSHYLTNTLLIPPLFFPMRRAPQTVGPGTGGSPTLKLKDFTNCTRSKRRRNKRQVKLTCHFHFQGHAKGGFHHFRPKRAS
ncbi:hypothetical protein B0T26DRAFT_180588 [Lasiosphaeria miniovina]|uniref:Uncharacterized protein n=1 Tax=Lasiosphaeria miniovina TaxID=1954250 RepID=A0AA40B6M1_9PEZI|nr:uncharacterized protein B0T26DRAFT_180588 [Lasiosphaeria miniovina]KAK0728655.1 hypothetical protein B0T26DRAFT_180588 [Lasiosphaeria miniovina]